MRSKIHRRAILAGGLALAGGAALAQSDSGLVHVVLKTGLGPIGLELDVGHAPLTAGHFLRYVDQKRYDGARFFRASHADNDVNYGLIEGGIHDATKLLKPIAHESTLKTGLSHKDGAISLARGKLGSANADFFICIGDHEAYDAHPDTPGDNEGFAVFGHVTDGMDAVKAIFTAHTSPTLGVGAMKGEMLSPPVIITTARRAA